MAKAYQAPLFARIGNVLTTALLRAGFKLVGFGKYPMYLLTVKGRKSGQPRTISMVIIERNGKRYLGAPFGAVAWVRNLRAAGEAILGPWLGRVCNRPFTIGSGSMASCFVSYACPARLTSSFVPCTTTFIGIILSISACWS